MTIMKTPDFEGGFITKQVKDGWIYAYDNGGNILNVKPVNYVHKGVECKYGRIEEYSENIAILKKGHKHISIEREKLNNYLQKSFYNDENIHHPEETISGTFLTPVGAVSVDNAERNVRDVLTNPDTITQNRNNSTFRKSIGENNYTLIAEKGMIKALNIKSKKIKLLFKGVAATATPSDIKTSTGNGWNQRGGMKPGHKYIQRKEDGTKPDGSPKYIYLYQLPNGQKEWRDENGKPAGQQSKQAEYKPDFEIGDIIKQGSKVGKIVEASDNFLAINYEGKIETINKNEHLQKVKEHELYKEGDETTYNKQPAKILKVTDKMALIKTQNDKQLHVIALEKQFNKQKPGTKPQKEQKPEEPLQDYEQTPEYNEFLKAGEEAGFGKLGDLQMRKFVKVGKTVHSVEWKYNPDLKEVQYYVDGQRDRSLDFMGEQFKVRDISDKGWSLENEAGETGLFLSHKDYEKALEDTDRNIYEEEREDLGDSVGEVIHYPKKTYHFSGKLSDEQLRNIEQEKMRNKPGRMVMKKKEEPLQTATQKAAIEAERANKQAQVKEALTSNSYADFSKAMKERGFEIGENKFTASKKVEVGGKKFEVNSKYKPDDGVWETSIQGPHEKLQLGEKEFPITDITDGEVYYQDKADEKKISIKDLESINGKNIFEPTGVSKGIVSSLPPQKIHFGLNDEDSTAGYYEIVSADDLTASHLSGGEANKNYSISDAQNRDRSTPQSLAQINKIAATPIFDFVGDSKTADLGAPIVNQNYNIIAGNGRAIGLQQHYQNGGDKYKKDLLNNAEKLGFKKEDIEKIKNPVLIRKTNVDNKEAQRLGAISNTSNMLAPEAREEAKGKATRIDDKTFNNLAGIFEKAKGDHRSISDYLDEVGTDIAKELVSKNIIPENEQHLYFNTTSGKLDASHKGKLKALLTQSILGDSSKEFERIPDTAREGISKALGDIFSLKGKSSDLVPHLQNAVKILAKYSAVKDRFNSPDEFIAQDSNNAFEKLSGSKEDLALFDILADPIRGVKKENGQTERKNVISKFIREYKMLTEGDMFSEGLKPEEAFDQVFKPKYEKGINKSLLSRIKLFGKRFIKAVNTAQLELFPSPKNPSVRRWQNLNKEKPQEKPLEPAQPFYYKSAKILGEKMPNAASVEQIKGILSIVPESEQKWLGIDDYLNAHANEKINKVDLLNFIKDNELKIDEVKRGLPATWRVEYVPIEGNWATMDESGEVMTIGATREAAIERISYAQSGQPNGEVLPKYSQYTLPGGENYRELLFLMQNKEGLSPIEQTEFEQLQNEKKGWNIKPEQVHRYNELAAKAYYDRQESFKSAHWDEFNIIAHTRIDDRIIPSDKAERFDEDYQRWVNEGGRGKSPNPKDYGQDQRILFIEEIQSDWAREGRKKGFKNNGDKNRFDEIVKRLREIEKENNVRSDDLDGLVKLQETNKEYRELGEEGSKINPNYEGNKVPDMPFRSNWHEFVMKRLLREAAEKGYDKLAWTTGEQQAERYDLSKKIDEIKYKETFPGRYEFTAVRNGTDALTKSGLNKNQLEEYLGKDAAQKIIDGVEANNKIKTDPTKHAREFMRLSGADLKIGGEWANTLYDKVIPSFLEKYGKKWGIRVGETRLKLTDMPMSEYEKYPVEHPYVQKNAPMVHSIDLTPEMRASILYDGQPMFGKSKRIIIFGKKFLQKSIDTTKNILMPSKKNPNIKRWQSTDNKDIPEETTSKERVNPKITAFGKEVKIIPEGMTEEKSQMPQNKDKIIYKPEFKKWFGDWENNPQQSSRVIGVDGKPLEVYHGTRYDFDEFSQDRSPFFFADKKGAARNYAADKSRGDNKPRIIPSYLKITNPLIFDHNKIITDEIIEKAKIDGYDGIIAKNVKDYPYNLQLLNEDKFNRAIELMKKMEQGEELTDRERKNFVEYTNQLYPTPEPFNEFIVFNKNQIRFSEPSRALREGGKNSLQEVKEFARAKHGDQKYNGGNYFDNHIMKVAEKAREIANSGKAMKQTQDEVEIAAYLHDVLEDTNTTYDEIAERFGKGTADIVLLLSGKLKVHDESRRPQAEGRLTGDEYFKGIGSDFHATIIKAADRIENIQSLSKVEDPKRRKELYDKYKDEMKYFRENRIYPGPVEAELGKAESVEQSAKGANQIYSENFKKWFGDWENDPENASKVVGEDGKPLVVYHGTKGNFKEFDSSKTPSTSVFDITDIKPIYFTNEPGIHGALGYGTFGFTEEEKYFQKELTKLDNQITDETQKKNTNYKLIDTMRNEHKALGIYFEIAKKRGEKGYTKKQYDDDNKYLKSWEKYLSKDNRNYAMTIAERGINRTIGATVMNVFLKIENPLVKDYNGHYFNHSDHQTLINEAIINGNDGIIIKNVDDPVTPILGGHPHTQYLVFSPNQIKSAIGNDGSFDAENPDITKSKGISKI